MTIQEILTCNEGQSFDRKSIRIAPKDLAETIVAMANADGGTIAIGVTDRKRDIEGVARYKAIVKIAIGLFDLFLVERMFELTRYYTICV